MNLISRVALGTLTFVLTIIYGIGVGKDQLSGGVEAFIFSLCVLGQTGLVLACNCGDDK